MGTLSMRQLIFYWRTGRTVNSQASLPSVSVCPPLCLGRE